MTLLTVGFGAGSLLLFALFLWTGGIQMVSLGLSPPASLALDAALSVAFFVQHSGMVRRGFRARLAGFVPARYHGVVYTLASGAVLVLLCLLWQTAYPVAAAAGPARWILRAVSLAAVAGLGWAFRSSSAFDLFGVSALRARPAHAPLTIRGAYRLVRHPFYLFTIVGIWACPWISADRLLLNILFTAWIVTGARLEERDLAAEFGADYEAYRRAVPMLVPWSRRSASSSL